MVNYVPELNKLVIVDTFNHQKKEVRIFEDDYDKPIFSSLVTYQNCVYFLNNVVKKDGKEIGS